MREVKIWEIQMNPFTPDSRRSIEMAGKDVSSSGNWNGAVSLLRGLQTERQRVRPGLIRGTINVIGLVAIATGLSPIWNKVVSAMDVEAYASKNGVATQIDNTLTIGNADFGHGAAVGVEDNLSVMDADGNYVVKSNTGKDRSFDVSAISSEREGDWKKVGEGDFLQKELGLGYVSGPPHIVSLDDPMAHGISDAIDVAAEHAGLGIVPSKLIDASTGKPATAVMFFSRDCRAMADEFPGRGVCVPIKGWMAIATSLSYDDEPTNYIFTMGGLGGDGLSRDGSKGTLSVHALLPQEIPTGWEFVVVGTDSDKYANGVPVLQWDRNTGKLYIIVPSDNDPRLVNINPQSNSVGDNDSAGLKLASIIAIGGGVKSEELLPPELQAWQDHFVGAASVEEVDGVGILVDESGARIGSETDVWSVRADGKLERTYHPWGDERELTVLYKPSEIGIVRGDDGEPTGEWNLSGWVRNIEGEFVRENVISPEGKETEIPKYSTYEVTAMMWADTLEFLEKFGAEAFNNPDSQWRRESGARGYELMGFDGKTPSIRYQGIQFPAINASVYDSRIYVVDENGKKVAEIPTMFLVYNELRQNGQSDVRWVDVKGELKEYIVDAKLGTIDYYNQHGVTPFVVTEEQAIDFGMRQANNE